MSVRRLSIILVFTVISVLFTLSGGQAQKHVQVNIVATSGVNAPAVRAVAPFCEKKYPNISINVIEIPWTDVYYIQLLDFMSKQGRYDITMQSTSFFAEYAIGGFLEPLDGYLNNSELIDREKFDFNDFSPKVVQKIASYKGKLYALPFMYFPQIVAYREDLIKKIGAEVPKTIDEYLEVVKKLDKLPGIHGTSIIGIKGGAGGNVYAWAPWLFAFGGDFADAQGNPTLDTPEAVKALEYYIRLYKYSPSEAINMGTDNVNSAFAAGNIGIIIMDADNCTYLLDPSYSKVVEKTKFATLPEGPYKGTVLGQGTPLLGAWSIGINVFSKHKNEAFKVMTSILSKDVASTFAKYGLCPRMSVLRAFGSKYPNYGIVAKELEDIKSIPIMPKWPQIEETLATSISQSILGRMSPKDALNQAQRVAQTILEKK